MVGTGKAAARARLCAIAVLLAGAMAIPTTAIARSLRNANFVGKWTPNAGLTWTITRENRRTGVCAGKTALASYHIVNCRVRGNKYSFTVTYGPSYKSHNNGTIHGNTLSGRFHDTNGTSRAYTAKRARTHMR